MKRKRKDLRFPNSYGGIVYLGGRRRKPYAVRITEKWTDDKKQKYRYLGYFEKRVDALQCLVEYNKNPYDLDARQITFFEVYEKWAEKHYEKVSKLSVRNYRSQIKKFEPLYNKPFYDLNANHYQEIIDQSPKSVAHSLKSMLASIYMFAIKREIVDKDYSKAIDLPIVERKEKTIFTNDEINLLWKQEGEIYADMLLILLYSGMRITELLEMRSENVNIDERYMRGGIKTKAGIDRVIPIHKKIEPIIKRNIGSNFIFQGSQGGHYWYNIHGQKIIKFMKSIGINHTIHETRHTFISQCDRLELNKLLTKRVVGHHTGDITDKYTHKHIQETVDFIDKFDY